MSKKEGTSIALAFAGFAVLVLTFKGTWGNMFGALVGHKPGAPGAGASTGGVAAMSGQLAYPVSAGTLAFQGVTSGRPAQTPASAGGAAKPATPSRPSGPQPWESTNTPSGYTAAAVLAAAKRYASGRSYGGQPYSPQHVVQEGHIEYRNGKPGVMVKYATGGLGTSTEWTPL